MTIVGALALLGPACVNNYVVDAESSTSTGSEPATEVGTRTSGGSSSTTGSGSSSSSSSTSSSETTDGSSSTSGVVPDPLPLCGGPCSTDAMCGGPLDLCVLLFETQDPVCLVQCPGRSVPCPDGFSCQDRTSVDGDSRGQCVPLGNQCG